MTPDDGNSFLQTVGFWEWAVGLAWPAGLTVVIFIWRLTSRVAILEHSVKVSEENVQKRHEENLAALQQLTTRIDWWVGGHRRAGE